MKNRAVNGPKLTVGPSSGQRLWEPATASVPVPIPGVEDPDFEVRELLPHPQLHKLPVPPKDLGLGLFQERDLADFLRNNQYGEAVPTQDTNSPTPPAPNLKTKSALIRYYHAQNLPVKEIARLLNLKYQHVRNVLVKELKRGPREAFQGLEGLEGFESPNLKSKL